MTEPLPKHQFNIPTLKKALIWGFFLIPFFILSVYNYPAFHSFADMATVFIAGSVFVVVWNRRHVLDNHYYLFVGIAFVFYAFLDFMHLLGNKGIGIFPGYGNLGPTFYIASRYLLGISLLLAPAFIKRKVNVFAMFSVYLFAATLILLSVFLWRSFPATFIEGVGLTPFKIFSDYLICATILGAIAVLYLNRRAFDPRVFRLFIHSLLLSVASGLAFTFYADPFDITNTIGHVFQVASFYLIYRAFVETILNKPQDILYRSLRMSAEENLKLNTKLKNTNFYLKQKEAELREAQRIAHIGSWSWDSATDTMAWSDEFLRIYGFDPETETMPDFKDQRGRCYPIPDWERINSAAKNTIKTGVGYEIEVQAFRNGVPIWITTRGEAVHDDAGKVIGLRGTVQDTTYRKMGEERLRNFISVLAHELRNPLSPIVLEVEMLKMRENTDREVKESYEVIERQAANMTKLLKELLDVSRIERGKVELSKKDVELSTIIEGAAEASKPLITKAKQELKITMPEGSMLIHADQLRVGQIITNLLNNASKYSEENKLIEMIVEKLGDKAVIKIKDYGVGISTEAQKDIFALFSQNETMSRVKGGLGVGLYLSRELAQLHGGSITVKSAGLGKGSEFIVTLPLK
ncbi:MAG: MASE3 domain-containing protein [Candidatus Paceibacterota bacterium]|jgi:PAS domain S-box-containing protein|nr:ATP-binding protein [Candidatus Paceibacterota bacterium]